MFFQISVPDNSFLSYDYGVLLEVSLRDGVLSFVPGLGQAEPE